MIVEVSTAKGNVCRDILVGLPDWFGIPESIEAYARDVERMTMFAYMLDGAPTGFIAIERHYLHAAEACVLGVRRAYHRRGSARLSSPMSSGCYGSRVSSTSRSRRSPTSEQTRLTRRHGGFTMRWGSCHWKYFPRFGGLKIPA
jgi:hypothetical protein